MAGLPTTPGWQWYPYSYLGGFLLRRGGFLMRGASQLPAVREVYAARALCTLRQALQCFAAGAAVLARYHFSPTGEPCIGSACPSLNSQAAMEAWHSMPGTALAHPW